MKKLTLLLLLHFVMWSHLQSQYVYVDTTSFVFELKAAEARALMQNSNELDESYFHSLVDSFDYKNTTLSPISYPSGHYLIARAEGQHVSVSFESVNTISAVVLPNKRDLLLQVYDSLGQQVTNAKVQIGNKEIIYNSKKGGFYKAKWKKEGLVEITTDEETLFYQLQKKNKKWNLMKERLRYFSNRGIGRIVTTPIRIGKKTYYFVRNSFRGHGYLSSLPSNLRYRWRSKYQYKGYLVVNQPKYLPGDSVKVKAYIANYKGKPLKRELHLKFTSYAGKSQKYFDIPIQADKNGNYIYEFSLGDSLKLDQDYSLTFYDTKRWRKNEFRQDFKYEDYQLDEVNWSFSSSKERYHAKEPVVLFAEGKDANGNTIPDGQLRLTVLPGQVEKYYESPIYIPDTIWHHAMPLRARDQTQIIVPDSILTKTNMKLLVKADLLNSNGELHQEEVNLSVSRNPERIDTKVENGQVYAFYFKDGKMIDTTGVVEYWLNDDADTYTSDTIRFPFKQKINPYINDYSFEIGDLYESIYLGKYNSDAPADVHIIPSWNDGLAEFRLSNPHQIPVKYSIRTKDRLVLEDSSSVSKVIFSKDTYKGAYYVSFAYVWGGEVYNYHSELRPYKKQLDITVIQDEEVRPGDLVKTEIHVRNYKGEAVEGVNLTSGSYNSQFKDSNNFTAPRINYKGKRPPFWFSDFLLNRPEVQLKNLPMNRFFYENMNLKEHLFYKVRYDNLDGIILHYDSLAAPKYADLAQVAPFVIKDGKEVPAELIYINSQLVYYAGTTIRRPYSFLGYAGKNTITIRTRQNEYTIMDVELKKGNKLELFLNSDASHKLRQVGKVVSKGGENKLTVQEKRILNSSLFQFQKINPSNCYLWQDEGLVFPISNYQSYRHYNYLVGPIQPNRNIGIVVQDFYMKKLDFTPGYKYEIFQNRERLYANTLFDLNEKYIIPKRWNCQPIGELVHTISDIVTRTPKAESIFFESSNFENKERIGRFEYALPRDSTDFLRAIAITNNRDTLLRLLNPRVRRLSQLEEGTYNIYFFTVNGSYAKHSFTVKSSYLLYEDLSDLSFRKDSLETIFTSFANEVYDTPKQKLDPYTAQFIHKKQNAIVGKVNNLYQDSIQNVFQLKLFKDDLLIVQTQTDTSGYYQLEAYPGIFDLQVTNIKDGSAFSFPVYLGDSSLVRLDLVHHQKGFYLNQIEVIGYVDPLIRMDNTTAGTTVTSEEIKNLPLNKSRVLQGKVSGVTIEDSGQNLNIRGARTEGAVYYVDGVQVSGNLIPESEVSTISLPNIISGKITDENGEVLMFCNVALVVDGMVIAGTTTDIDGIYNIRVPNGPFEIEVSYIGFENKRVNAFGTNQVLDISLKEGGAMLDEVVVVGYSEPTAKSFLDLNSLDESPPPLQGGVQLRSDFRDYSYWQPNLITDKDGKASFQTVFPDKITSWKTFVVGMNKKSQAGVAYSYTKSVKPLVAQLATPRFLVEGDEANIIGKTVNYTSETYPVESSFLQEGEVIQTNTSEVKEALIEQTKINAPYNVDSLSITYKLQTGDYGDGEQREIPVFPNGIEETLGAFYVLEGDTTVSIDFDVDKGPVTIYAQSDVLSLMLEDLDYLVKYPYGCNEQTASRLMALLLEKQVRKTLNQPFEHEDKIIKMIIRLKRAQNEDGSWGWWSNNVGSNWITVHALKALAVAKKEGYTSSAFEKGIRYVTNFLPSSSKMQQLEILELFSAIEQRADFDTYLLGIDSLDLTLQEQFRVIKIKQEQNLAYELDSLEVHRRTTLFGGEFWGENSSNILSDDVALSLLAYQIYENEGDEKRLQAIQQFFMMRRSELSYTYGRRFGRNTYETAKILAVLLPELLDRAKGGELKTNELVINGDRTQKISEFPFKQVVYGESTIEVSKEGAGTLYLTAYQQFFNKKPQPKRDVFDVETKLIQNDKPVKKLSAGERVELLVNVKVDKKTEYAMIEIPIPAACSYASKPNSRRGIEVHREYFKDKTAIFCRNLPEGNHEFKIELEARFAGQYTLLPSKVEQMYFPVFYGRNEVRKVIVH